MTTADLLFGLFDRLRDFIRRSADKGEAQKRAANDALVTAVQIANRTIRYIADRREGVPRSRKEEAELSSEWAFAGGKLALLASNDPSADDVRQLANRYFMKAEYWSDPDSWTQERVDSAMIRLDELANESRTLLLGRHA